MRELNGILPKRKTRIGVCYFTMGEKYSEENIKYGKRTVQHYCDKYEYSFLHRTTPYNPDRPPQWNKIGMLLEFVDQFDILLWIDADIIIMNECISITDLLETYLDKDCEMLLSMDFTGHINTGFWIVKCSQFTRTVLESINNFPELGKELHEQDVFERFYNLNFLEMKKKIKVIQNHNIANCCVGNYKYGRFLIHFMSISKDGLRKAFADFYPRRKDDESGIEYNNRMIWLRQFNQHLEY